MNVNDSYFKYTVVILQRVLPHYRVEFFSRLSQCLKINRIRLRVIYGQERADTVPKTVHPEVDWAEYIPNLYFSYGNIELVWQGGLFSIIKSDLVIVEQASRLLINYPLIGLRASGLMQLAYWGHGRNLQSSDAFSIKERIKRRLINSVDYWFAYTRLSAEIVRAAGYSNECITIVENSINTDELEHALSSVTSEQLKSSREHLSLGSGPVGLYCGGMYPDKHLQFLLQAAELIREKIPNFNLLLIGDGPDEKWAKLAAEKHRWVHYLGSVYGKERAVYFSLCDVMLMPGLVGLAIVDSFVAGLPLITTDIPIHSPEISYLQNNVNGIMTAHSLCDYASLAIDVLSSDSYLSRLREGCRVSANQYTLNAMVENFSSGIATCLSIDV